MFLKLQYYMGFCPMHNYQDTAFYPLRASNLWNCLIAAYIPTVLYDMKRLTYAGLHSGSQLARLNDQLRLLAWLSWDIIIYDYEWLGYMEFLMGNHLGMNTDSTDNLLIGVTIATVFFATIVGNLCNNRNNFMWE